MANLDLDKLKSEIDSRKKDRGQLMESAGVMPRDAILSDLVSSLNTGTPSRTVRKMKVVEQISKDVKVAGDIGSPIVTQKPNINPNLVNEFVNEQPPQEQKYKPKNVNSNQYDQVDPNHLDEREYAVNVNLKKQYSQAGFLNEYNTGMHNPQSLPHNYTQQPYPPVAINPNILNEQVNNSVLSFMNENFAPIVQEAMKNTIVEMYSIERIKKTLDENRDLIEKIVIETITKLQNRKKQQQSGN